jgi:cell division protein ZapE
MEQAVAAFAPSRLICIDEFELDDVANTRMAVTFLRAIVDSGTTVVTTSNAVPDRLGEGRFNAEDFAREIADIASHFEVVRIDGPDFRAAQHAPTVDLSSDDDVRNVVASHGDGKVSVDTFAGVLAHLRKVHPVHYGALIDGLEAVVVEGVEPIENQGAALLFVQLIDEIYDAGITFAATGCPIGEIFPDSYRRGGYRKKYGRCESRLTALIAEARGGSETTTAG